MLHPLNPWGLLGVQPMSKPIQKKPFHIQMQQQPLDTLQPKNTNFMPHTGTGVAGQAHAYSDTGTKKEQEFRDLHTPWRAMPQEGLQR